MVDRSAFIWPLRGVDRETDNNGTGDGDGAWETALVVSSDVDTISGSTNMVTVSGVFFFCT